METVYMYRNKSYNMYGENNDCISTFTKDAGAMVECGNEVYKVLYTPTFTLDESNVDNFMESRGFEKVLESTGGSIKWFNNYDSGENKKMVKARTKVIKTTIGASKNDISDGLNYKATYAALNVLDTNIK